MAVDATPKLTRRRVIGVAIETTTGTAVTPAAGDATFYAFSPDMKYETEIVEREAPISLSPIIQYAGARGGTATFETELVGLGASGLPIWTRLLQCCGYTATGGTFAPADGSMVTCTIAEYVDGKLRMLAGCQGTAVFKIRRGQKGRIAWTFKGVQCPITDTALITPTWTTVIAPRCGATTFTIGGTAYVTNEAEIDLGNTLYLREDIKAKDSANAATGFRSAIVTDRRPTFKVSPEAVSVATHDWEGRFQSLATDALSLIIGSAANNTFTFAAPALQQIQDPATGDREKLQTDDLMFLCTRGSNAGQDELTIALS